MGDKSAAFLLFPGGSSRCRGLEFFVVLSKMLFGHRTNTSGKVWLGGGPLEPPESAVSREGPTATSWVTNLQHFCCSWAAAALAVP